MFTLRPLAAATALAVVFLAHTGAVPSPPVPDLRDTLVLANRILAMEGLVGPFGHVSVRTGPGRFVISKEDSVSAWIEAADLVPVDTTITTADVKKLELPSEVFIHSALYQELPGVNAVVHTHSPAAIALGTLTLSADKVLPTTNPGANLGNFIPRFPVIGLIQAPALAQRVARALQGQNGILLRGHGAVVVGATIEQAVLRAIYLELEARFQLASRAAGEPVFLQASESDLFKATGGVSHPWHYYVEKVKRLR